MAEGRWYTSLGGGKEMKSFHIDNSYIQEPRRFGDTFVYQIGLLHSDDSLVCDTHIHKNFFELTAIIDGEARVSANGTTLDLGSNDIFISFPFDTHKIESLSSKPLKYYFFAFDTANEQFRFQLDKITRDFPLIRHRRIHNDNIFSTLAQAVYEVTSDEVFSNEFCASLFDTVIIQLVREFCPPKSNIRIPNQNEIFAYSVMNYINMHIYTLTSLSALSEVFGYEYSHISKIFSKAVSQSLRSYYRHQRMETARSLLLEGKSVTEVAAALGYASVCSFSLSFKKQYGLSPMSYRQKSQEALLPPGTFIP